MNESDYLDKIRNRIQGPVVPLNIPFTENGEIDYNTFERYVDWIAGKGVPIIILTYGSSEYNVLSDKEIYELTRIGATVNRNRAHFVGATKYWSIKEVLYYIEHAAKYGSEAVKVQPDYWTGKYTTQSLTAYYQSIGEQSRFPLWAYTAGSNGMSPVVVKELTKTVPWVVALKNDSEAMYTYYDYIKAADGKIQIVSGGQMKTMLFGWQLGARAYLCTITPFYPEIGISFVDFLRKGDYSAAFKIIKAWEDPIIDLAGRYEWVTLIKAILNIAGLFPERTLRLPGFTANQQEYEEIKKAYIALMEGIKVNYDC